MFSAMAAQEGSEDPLEIFESIGQVYDHLGPGTRVELVQVGSPSCRTDGIGFPHCNGQVSSDSSSRVKNTTFPLHNFPVHSCRDHLSKAVKTGWPW